MRKERDIRDAYDLLAMAINTHRIRDDESRMIFGTAVDVLEWVLGLKPSNAELNFERSVLGCVVDSIQLEAALAEAAEG